MKKLSFWVMILTSIVLAGCSKPTPNKMLLIVDAQYDFIDGSLAVTGAPEKMDALAEYIKAQPQDAYKQIVMTADFHPANHSSFVENGGIWPAHCVQGQPGQQIWQPVLDAVKEKVADAPILTKGDIVEKEEYSIMESEASATRLLQIIEENNIDEIEVAGLCGDYCVGLSIKGLIEKGYGEKIVVLVPYIGNIDDGTVLKGIIEENNLKTKE